MWQLKTKKGDAGTDSQDRSHATCHALAEEDDTEEGGEEDSAASLNRGDVNRRNPSEGLVQ